MTDEINNDNAVAQSQQQAQDNVIQKQMTSNQQIEQSNTKRRVPARKRTQSMQPAQLTEPFFTPLPAPFKGMGKDESPIDLPDLKYESRQRGETIKSAMKIIVGVVVLIVLYTSVSYISFLISYMFFIAIIFLLAGIYVVYSSLTDYIDTLEKQKDDHLIKLQKFMDLQREYITTAATGAKEVEKIDRERAITETVRAIAKRLETDPNFGIEDANNLLNNMINQQQK
jgi:hypothetical protein